MDYNQLKRKYPNTGKIKRQDLADNFDLHYEKEIKGFAEDAKLSLGQTLNFFSSPAEKGRPTDAILDCMSYRGLRTKGDGGLAASPLCDFFDRDDPNFALGVGYLQNLFARVLDAGIEEDSQYSAGYPTPEEYGLVESAPNTRANLPHPFNPQTIGPLEITRDYRPRVQIRNVVATRRTIVGDQYEAPIVESPTDVGLRPIGEGGSLPRYTISLDDKITRTSEIGYELEMTDKLRRSSRVTMEAIARIQMQKAMQVESAIVDDFLQTIGTGATAFSMSATPTSEEVIELHMTPDDQYILNTFIGTLQAVAKYANVDIFYRSSNRNRAAGGQRNFIDSIFGNEFIAKKSNTKVAVLAGGDKMIAFDRRHCIDYIVEQRGTIQETYRENRERSTVIANAHSFAGHLQAEAGQCRWMITMS